MITLVDAEDNDHAVPARGGGDGLRDRAGHGDGVVVKPDMLPAGHDRRVHEGEVRVPGHEGLGEDRELRPLGGGIGDGVEHALQRARPALEIGRDLDGGDADHGALRHRDDLRASRC